MAGSWRPPRSGSVAVSTASGRWRFPPGELPERATAWCLSETGLTPEDLDAVGYSFDPGLCRPADEIDLHDPWERLRQEYARRAPQFLAAALPGLDPARVRFVPHHVAHAASTGLAAPAGADCAVLVLDGRGEAASHLAGVYRTGVLKPLYAQALPHSQATRHRCVPAAGSP